MIALKLAYAPDSRCSGCTIGAAVESDYELVRRINLRFHISDEVGVRGGPKGGLLYITFFRRTSLSDKDDRCC